MSREDLRSRGFWERAAVPAWYAAILAVILGSLWPKPPDVLPGQSDKLIHLLMYLVLAFIPARWFYPARKVSRAAVFVFILGVVLEIGQYWSPGRFFDWADLAANVAGTGIGLALGMTALRMVRTA